MGRIECTNRDVTTRNSDAGDVKITDAKRENVRVSRSRLKSDGTWESSDERTIVMEVVQLVSARGESTSVKEGTDCIRIGGVFCSQGGSVRFRRSNGEVGGDI
jgi:hypothetical protein